MSRKIPDRAVVGIDVGASLKGFHAVVLLHGRDFLARHFTEVQALVEWCLTHDSQVIAVDAPCAWAASGNSRLAERTLAVNGQRIPCFKTPTRASAHGRAFFDWVFHGEKLYQHLRLHYQLFDGQNRQGRIVFESFPHAIVCCLAGQVIPAHPKTSIRRQLLRDLGYETRSLTSLDFIDAALCALTARHFLQGRTLTFGDAAGGFIVTPG